MTTTRQETRPIIARAYLPLITRSMGRILSLQVKVNAAQDGAALYVRPSEWPEGATSTAYDLTTPEAVAAYRRAGAIITEVAR